MKIPYYQFGSYDFGSGTSTTAGIGENGQIKSIPNRETGDQTTPSVIYAAEGLTEILVGKPAIGMQSLDPHRVIVGPKKWIGTPDHVFFSDGDRPITPLWAAKTIYQDLHEDAIRFNGQDDALQNGVITVPVKFNQIQRQLICQAAEDSGINVMRIVNEPTAGSIAYGLETQLEEGRIAVYDLGAGTFDATILTAEARDYRVEATGGSGDLGGDYYGQLILNRVLAEIEKNCGLALSMESHPADFLALRDDCTRCKHVLSSRKKTKLISRIEGQQTVVELTRNWLNDAAQPIIQRTEEIILDTAKNASMSLDEIDRVVLIGGASRIPVFRELINRIHGKEKIVGSQISPDLAVAKGGASIAHELASTQGITVVNPSFESLPEPEHRHTDVMSHSLGVAVQDPNSLETWNSAILEKNTPLPCEIMKEFGSITNDQTRFSIKVLQGEDRVTINDTLIVAENEIELPPRDPSTPSIEVKMGYDVSGICNVVVTDRISGQVKDITIDFTTPQSLK